MVTLDSGQSRSHSQDLGTERPLMMCREMRLWEAKGRRFDSCLGHLPGAHRAHAPPRTPSTSRRSSRAPGTARIPRHVTLGIVAWSSRCESESGHERVDHLGASGAPPGAG
ncbi:hypothetical protein NOCARDAX2BIS_460032 [Nocardioides sp. AX2bis]|nr:hypothetical protein NOCARDAX2BIS_460032 [Nocardioides sp. AX2bis]